MRVKVARTYPIVESPSNVLQIGVVEEENRIAINPDAQLIHTSGPYIRECISKPMCVHPMLHNK